MNIGDLKIIATPIGNLEDISLRALRVLKELDFILCEDTRVSRKLLDYYKIKTPTISYHQHSGIFKTDKIISLLKENKNLGLISDAGTPGISDPGGKLVALLRKEFANKIMIESIPGVSALTTALSISGVNTDRFLFLGFLPHKKRRQSMLKEIIASPYPVILFESKYRLLKLITELNSLDRGLKIVVFRELTKLHESLYRGSPAEVLEELAKSPSNLKGEFVVLVNQS